MSQSLALECIRVTEEAAISAARLMGRGDEKMADAAAVDAMRRVLNDIDMEGVVVIGEGERDEAPMLYIGETVGTGKGPQVDIALDPLEGTTICAKAGENALAVLAISDKGCFLHAPDVYMQKIAVGPESKGLIDLNRSIRENIETVAKAKKTDVGFLTIAILNRPRHTELIEEVRAIGARVKLIDDGDVAAAIATCRRRSGVDMLIGSGGAPEGVLAAAALQCMGGDIQGKLLFKANTQIERAQKMGLKDPHAVLTIDQMASGNIIFCATGVTSGTFLRGVRFFTGGAMTHSVVMTSGHKTIRTMDVVHYFD